MENDDFLNPSSSRLFISDINFKIVQPTPPSLLTELDKETDVLEKLRS